MGGIGGKAHEYTGTRIFLAEIVAGYTQGDEAGKYGSGPSLETKYRAVNLVEHPWLTPALGKASN